MQPKPHPTRTAAAAAPAARTSSRHLISDDRGDRACRRQRSENDGDRARHSGLRPRPAQLSENDGRRSEHVREPGPVGGDRQQCDTPTTRPTLAGRVVRGITQPNSPIATSSDTASVIAYAGPPPLSPASPMKLAAASATAVRSAAAMPKPTMVGRERVMRFLPVEVDDRDGRSAVAWRHRRRSRSRLARRSDPRIARAADDARRFLG